MGLTDKDEFKIQGLTIKRKALMSGALEISEDMFAFCLLMDRLAQILERTK